MLAALLLALLPAVALADCTVQFRTIGPVKLRVADLKRPTTRQVVHATWKLDMTWTGVQPKLNQFVAIKGRSSVFGVTYARQRDLSIDAYAPEDHGWLYVDDSDSETAPCQMVGKSAWQAPRIWVKETAKEVKILAASQHSVGDATGCVLGPDQGVRECPLLTRNVLRLKKDIGARALIFERFYG